MKQRQILVLSMALGLAACGESSTEPGDELSAAEAGALASAILDLTLDAGIAESAPPARASGAAAAPVTFNYQTQADGPCPLGGTMHADLKVGGAFDSVTQLGQLQIDVKAQHRGCQVKAKESGQIFTLDGKPAIEAQLRLASKADGTYTLSGGYDGVVDWSSDGRSGTCHFDLDFSGTVNANTGAGTAKLQGTACGTSVSVDFAG